MTGGLKTPPEEEPAKQSDIPPDTKPDKPVTKPQPDDAAVTTDPPGKTHPTEPENAGVFGAWGFDVNAVAGNIGGFFTADDDTPESDVPHESPDDISAAAANIANVASTEIEHASKAAQETFGKAAEELGKGWGTLNTFLDDMLTPDVDGVDVAQGKDVKSTFHTLFPELDQEDQVVDHFECAMIQKYRCYLNNATPEKAYPLRGRLFISTTHVAMYITDDRGVFGNQPFGFTVAFADVGKILKQKGANAMLKIVTKSQQSYIFADFESDSHFSGALSLLEHMTSGAAPPKSSPAKEEEGNTEKPAAG